MRPPGKMEVSRSISLHVSSELKAESNGSPVGPTGNQGAFTPLFHVRLILSLVIHDCSETIY